MLAEKLPKTIDGGRIARRDASGNVYYYFPDALGSEVSITNATGTPCYDADFYLFGGEKVFTNTCSQNYKFAGMERDSETGLDHTLFRQYSSQYGRWISPDPMGGNVLNPQSLNRYAYVDNNPASLTDPMGLDSSNPADPCSGIGWEENALCAGPTDQCPPGDIECQLFYLNGPLGIAGGGSGGAGGGGGGSASSAPPAGQPPLAGGGLGGWPNGDVYGPTGPLTLWDIFGPPTQFGCEPFGLCGGGINGLVTGVRLVNGRYVIYIDVAQKAAQAGELFQNFISLLHRVQGPVEVTLAAGTAAATGIGMVAIGAGIMIGGCAGSIGFGCPAAIALGLVPVASGGIALYGSYRLIREGVIPAWRRFPAGD